MRIIAKVTVKFDDIESVIRIPIETPRRPPPKEVERRAKNLLGAAVYNCRVELEGE